MIFTLFSNYPRIVSIELSLSYLQSINFYLYRIGRFKLSLILLKSKYKFSISNKIV